MLENVCALRMLFPPDTSIDYQLNSFLLAITWQEMSKGPEKASSLPCSWHTSVPDSGSALQAWGNEENNCTLLLARNPLGYTDALFFFQGLISLSAPYCAGPSHLGAWQGSGPRDLDVARISTAWVCCREEALPLGKWGRAESKLREAH